MNPRMKRQVERMFWDVWDQISEDTLMMFGNEMSSCEVAQAIFDQLGSALPVGADPLAWTAWKECSPDIGFEMIMDVFPGTTYG